MKQRGKIVPPVSPLVQTKLVAINPTNYRFGALITREGKNCKFLWVNRVNQTTATLFGIKVSAQFGEMSNFKGIASCARRDHETSESLKITMTSQVP
jgi:hypothetical protein